MTEKKRTMWGHARLEMRALGSEILARLDDVGSARQLYAELRESGRLTISEASFYRHLSRIRRDVYRSSAQPPTVETARPASLPASATPSVGKAVPPPPMTKLAIGATAAAKADDDFEARFRQMEGLRELPRFTMEELWGLDDEDEDSGEDHSTG